MHAAQLVEMDRLLTFWHAQTANVLDVGSFDVNGSYREMVERRGWHYTGLDISPGKNVDVVAEHHYHFPYEDGAFDVVISGSTMEHVEDLVLWVAELMRLLRTGGMLAIITHTNWAYHPHPVDCWRILPDGMAWLFGEVGGLDYWEINMYCATDISAVAWRIAD
jgi:SAM-dependent methyltransferase